MSDILKKFSFSLEFHGSKRPYAPDPNFPPTGPRSSRLCRSLISIHVVHIFEIWFSAINIHLPKRYTIMFGTLLSILPRNYYAVEWLR